MLFNPTSLILDYQFSYWNKPMTNIARFQAASNTTTTVQIDQEFLNQLAEDINDVITQHNGAEIQLKLEIGKAVNKAKAQLLNKYGSLYGVCNQLYAKLEIDRREAADWATLASNWSAVREAKFDNLPIYKLRKAIVPLINTYSYSTDQDYQEKRREILLDFASMVRGEMAPSDFIAVHRRLDSSELQSKLNIYRPSWWVKAQKQLAASAEQSSQTQTSSRSNNLSAETTQRKAAAAAKEATDYILRLLNTAVPDNYSANITEVDLLSISEICKDYRAFGFWSDEILKAALNFAYKGGCFVLQQNIQELQAIPIDADTNQNVRQSRTISTPPSAEKSTRFSSFRTAAASAPAVTSNKSAFLSAADAYDSASTAERTITVPAVEVPLIPLTAEQLRIKELEAENAQLREELARLKAAAA